MEKDLSKRRKRSQRYYLKNREQLAEKSRERYRNLTEEQKERKRAYGKCRNTRDPELKKKLMDEYNAMYGASLKPEREDKEKKLNESEEEHGRKRGRVEHGKIRYLTDFPNEDSVVDSDGCKVSPKWQKNIKNARCETCLYLNIYKCTRFGVYTKDNNMACVDFDENDIW